ncbi:unnamed protein product [Prunus armeniaca]|uniref:Uncharacterized protein n=1 Tax=Prunus armeniaca TaxID=36596 RepID=A0A6J5W8Y7_PRUAR|nr:unnamed protein product [Prunus armeniaca]
MDLKCKSKSKSMIPNRALDAMLHQYSTRQKYASTGQAFDTCPIRPRCVLDTRNEVSWTFQLS